jgi:hypothetical protein
LQESPTTEGDDEMQGKTLQYILFPDIHIFMYSPHSTASEQHVGESCPLTAIAAKAANTFNISGFVLLNEKNVINSFLSSFF